MALLQQHPPPASPEGSSHHAGNPRKRSGSRSSLGSASARTSPSQPHKMVLNQQAAAPQCPVVHHAPSQPLPPGHPPTHSTPASSLKPPLAERCVFYRTQEDSGTPPTLSRMASSNALVQNPTTGEMLSATEFLKQHANVQPLREGEQLELDPEHSLVLASRNSQLALIQSSYVHSLLEARYGRSGPLYTKVEKEKEGSSSSSNGKQRHSPEAVKHIEETAKRLGLQQPCHFPITGMSTAGDHNQRSPLYVIGGEGKAIWTKELEVALKAGAVDAIVHCLKDVPTTLPDGLEIAAILQREDPRDALVMKHGLPYKTLDELPPGSVIGTSSVRRVAQLRSRYPKLVFSDVRGNLNTRLAKLDAPTGPYTALILAAAGLHRLSFDKRITAYLSPPVLYYAVGQGALGIEVRTPPPGATPANNRDARIREMIRSIGCWQTEWTCEAERALLRKLEGGCSIPVGVDTWIGEQPESERKGKVFTIRKRSESTAKEEHVHVEGHTCTESHEEVDEEEEEEEQPSSNGAKGGASLPARPDLQRLETGADEVAAAPVEDPASQLPHIPRLPEPETISIENLCATPAGGARLNLSSNVVSLDGTRRSNAYLSTICHTLEDAIKLGEDVAEVLIHDQGARVILEEVERHRAMAEQADERRRQERRERLKQMDVDSGAHAQEEAHIVPGAAKDLEKEQQKLAQVIGLQEELNDYNKLNGNGGLGYGEGAATGEIDRRGVARDDGQAKAWEV